MRTLTYADPVPTTDTDALTYLPSGEEWRRMYRKARLRGASIYRAMVDVLDRFASRQSAGEGGEGQER